MLQPLSVSIVSATIPVPPLCTDSVRNYLKEIGQIPLLTKEQEVAIAQQVQRYVKLVELRQKAEKGDVVLQQYKKVLEAQQKLSAQLGRKPSLEQWAAALEMSVFKLKQELKAGQQRWAEVAGLDLKEIEQAQKVGIRAKEQMLCANLRLVVSVAKKYQNRGLEFLDLIQEGTLGLERAVDKFDPTKGFKFSTYAYWWIRQGITRALATQSRTIRLPVHITEKLNKIKKAQRELAQGLGRTATIEEVALELNLSASQVREVLLNVPRWFSLDLKVGEEKDTELKDLLESKDNLPEEVLIQESLEETLQNLLDKLSEKQRTVIILRFGLDGEKIHSLAEIGRVLDLSRERVRQIEAKALNILRHPKSRRQLREFLNTLD